MFSARRHNAGARHASLHHSVCCESTARDEMMRDFRTVMVSDGNAAITDSEHEAALLGFHAMFGDVVTVTECQAGFAAGAKEMAA
ncbi:isochorismatase family protein [Rhodovarius sp.]|uniref:isochorismatase family protein n=1 Tax=Rhodovarius sp. TaxID=2972673 RepID=UPI0034A37303